MKSTLRRVFYSLFKAFIIRKAEPGAIYLTFDDGPHPENTEKILYSLAKYKAEATFFMIGEQMDRYPEIVESVIRAGHTIGYHSYNHRSLKKSSVTDIRIDLSKVDSLSSRFNYPIKLYRPPFGDLTPYAFLLLLLHRRKIVMWSLDCRDSFDPVDQVIANINPLKLEDGEIILFHDDYAHAQELVESSLALYQASNLVCKRL